MLTRLLTLFGINRWLDSLSAQMHEAVAEGSSALEARALLAKQEWLEEKVRLQQLLITTLLSIGVAVGVLISLSMALVITFWDTESRVLVAWMIFAFWSISLVISITYLCIVIKRGKRTFYFTKQELKGDWKVIKDQL